MKIYVMWNKMLIVKSKWECCGRSMAFLTIFMFDDFHNKMLRSVMERRNRRTCYKNAECHLSIAFIEKPTRNEPGKEKQFYLWGKLCTMLWSFYYILSDREKYLCDKFRSGQFIDLIILHYYFWYATHHTSHLLDPHNITGK